MTIDEKIHGNLDEETVAQCEKVMGKIKDIRMASDRPLVPAELFEAAEFLHSFRSWVTGPLLKGEAVYRDKIEEIRVAGSSVSAAETSAKTSPEYRAFRYLSRMDDLADEQIKLVKKFFERTADEFRYGGGI